MRLLQQLLLTWGALNTPPASIPSSAAGWHQGEAYLVLGSLSQRQALFILLLRRDDRPETLQVSNAAPSQVALLVYPFKTESASRARWRCLSSQHSADRGKRISSSRTARLGCQDLYLGELESDWNSDWNPEQALPGGKENVCIVTSEMSLQKT